MPGNGYGENIVKMWNVAKTVTSTIEPPAEPDIFTPYLVKVTASVLNYRSGAGTNYPINGTVKIGEAYTIVSKANGTGATKCGKLKSGAGWISLDHVVKNYNTRPCQG